SLHELKHIESPGNLLLGYFPVFWSIQVAEHGVEKIQPSHFVLIDHTGFHFCEQWVNFVLPATQSFVGGNGKLPPVHGAKRMPMVLGFRDGYHCAAATGFGKQVAKEVRFNEWDIQREHEIQRRIARRQGGVNSCQRSLARIDIIYYTSQRKEVAAVADNGDCFGQ